MPNISFVSAEYWHTCASDATGCMVCWGKNNYGQLGYGDLDERGANDNTDGLDMASLQCIDLGSDFLARYPRAGSGYSCAVSTSWQIKVLLFAK